MAESPTVAPRRIDVPTLVVLVLSAAIALLALFTLVQVDAAAAAAGADGGARTLPALAEDQLTQRRVLLHLTSLRRFAGVALASSVGVLGAGLLLRRASRRLAEDRW